MFRRSSRLGIGLLVLLLAMPLAGHAPPLQNDSGAVPPIERTDWQPNRQAAMVTTAVLRDGPTSHYNQVSTLGPGQALTYLDSGEGWVQVRTASGQRGWLPGESVRLVDPHPNGLSLRYAVAPGRWEVIAPGLRVQLTAQDGAILLTVSGEAAAEATLTEARVPLALTLPAYGGPPGTLKIASQGITALELAPGSLRLHFAGPAPLLQAAEPVASGLQLRLAPALLGLTRFVAGSDIHYRLQFAGSPALKTGLWEGSILLMAPGTLLQAPELPPEVVTHQGADGLTLGFPSSRPFRLSWQPDGVHLILHSPGLAGKRIVVDPGHGGPLETGAVSPYHGLVEKHLNMEVALALQRLLEAAGATVIMTRTADQDAAPAAFFAQAADATRVRVDLQYRTILANQQQADLFLSIHHNAIPGGGATGSETYYSPFNPNLERSLYFGNLVQQEMVRSLGTANRGLLPEVFYVTLFTEAPSVLAEIAYLNHPTDSARLADPAFRLRAAEALARAVTTYFGPRPAALAEPPPLPLTPLRPLASQFGALVTWDESGQAAIVAVGERSLRLEPGTPLLLAAEEVLVAPAPPRLQNGEILVPADWMVDQLTRLVARS